MSRTTLTQAKCDSCKAEALAESVQDHQRGGWTTVSWRAFGSSPDHRGAVLRDLCPACSERLHSASVLSKPASHLPLHAQEN